MYIDLVLCRHKDDDRNLLFQAPKFSYLKPNDEVIVETKLGNLSAKVVQSITIDVESEVYGFITSMYRVTLPLKKVLAKVRYSEFEYSEETENGIDNA